MIEDSSARAPFVAGMSTRPVQHRSKDVGLGSVMSEITAQVQAETAAKQEQWQQGTAIDATNPLDGLSEVERNVATLGVSPDEWKPIGFMNKGHYTSLLQGNALSGGLAQKLEAYKRVAGGE